ncbi:MAG: phosphoserine transaminase [Defluviicoccus sp.]
MSTPLRPNVRPANPCFSSGPCAKRPGWSAGALADACVGRSHRSKAGKAKLKAVIDSSRALLGMPADFRLAIVPASDTGAVEMALWSLLGARGVDVLAWESFGKEWLTDITKQLKLKDVRTIQADYGRLPDLSVVTGDNDIIFTWNGTTSGVAVPNADWIPSDRKGLAIADATSAVFAWEMPWDKLDVVTYSWQKVLGGEAQHGMLALGPRAVARLESYTPPWPLPKLFRMTKNGKLIEGLFVGETINTPSMLAVEDALDALVWAGSVGGAAGLVGRCLANASAIEAWVGASPWIGFLAEDPATRSRTSVCLKVVDPAFTALPADAQAAAAKRLAALLESEKVAYDIGSYRDAPPGLRIWAGATVETADLQALFPWLDWAYAVVNSEIAAS